MKVTILTGKRAKWHTMAQGSEDWIRVRVGKLTASVFDTLLVESKVGTWGKGAGTLMTKLVGEQLSQFPSNSGYSGDACEWGHKYEPEAGRKYTETTKRKITAVGFVEANPWLGVSPDGITGVKGCVEIKCPYNIAIFVEKVLAIKAEGVAGIEKSHYIQMQVQMWVMAKQWCDYILYHPRMPEGKQLLITRVKRDKELVKKINERARLFIEVAVAMQKSLTW